MLVFWSVKGGSGTTVVASVLATALAQRASRHVRLVDLAGDVPAALGLAEPQHDGIHEWLNDSTSGLEALCNLEIESISGMSVVPRGRHTLIGADGDRIRALFDTLHSPHVDTIVDAGSGAGIVREAIESAARSILVVRPCYLALRAASRLDLRIDGVVLVSESGRALGKRDVECVLGAPVVAEVPVAPHIARLIDAGLLSSRVPRDTDALLDLVA
jgi:MinD-like ATPase involved in chromosome partitioning or flagellar assembly